MNTKKFAVLLTLLSFLTVSPVWAQSYEHARMEQVNNTMKTSTGVQIKQAVNKYSLKYDMDSKLIHAVILTESGYRQYAKSPCGASGLMQLMSGTFKARNVGNNVWDIDQNIHAGVKHLSGLKAKYKGNIYLALAAYNAGGGYVDKYNGNVPPSLKGYVNKVMYHKQILENVEL